MVIPICTSLTGLRAGQRRCHGPATRATIRPVPLRTLRSLLATPLRRGGEGFWRRRRSRWQCVPRATPTAAPAADSAPELVAVKYIPMPDWPLCLQRAELADSAAVIGLIDDAAGWLRTRDTDQWRSPWPNRVGRNGRVLESIRQGKTWICWDRRTPAATLTADPDHDPYWSPDPGSKPAVYVHRLVVARRYAGMHLGASLLNWAGRTGRLAHGAHSIRISAWTTNLVLHQYYSRQGFSLRGFHADDGYPSAARFEKLTSVIPFSWPPLFSAPSRLVEP
jgi:hypothetical protein